MSEQAWHVRARRLLPYPFLIVGGIIMFLPLYMMLATSFKTTLEFYADPFGLPRNFPADSSNSCAIRSDSRRKSRYALPLGVGARRGALTTLLITKVRSDEPNEPSWIELP